MFDNHVPQPASPVIAPVAPMPPASPARRRRKGPIVAAIVVVLLLVLAAGGAYYVFAYRANPAFVLARMYAAMQDVTASSFTLTMEGDGTVEDKEGDEMVAAIDVMFEGATTWKDDTASVIRFSIATTAGTDNMMNIAGESRVEDDVSYFQLTTFDIQALTTSISPAADAFAPILGGIKERVLGRWITIDKAEITKSLKLDAFLEEREAESAALQEEHKAQVQAALEKMLPNLLIITSTLPSETVDGVATYHYAYTLNKDAVRTFLTDMQTIFGEDVNEDDLEQPREFLDNVGDISGELWIGKGDALVRKATVTMPLPEEALKKQKGNLTLVWTLTLSDFNEPVEVVAPENSTDIKTFFMEVLMGVSEDANADDDEDGLINRKEDDYGTDPENPDTDGDGYTDGDEVKNGYNPNGEGEIEGE